MSSKRLYRSTHNKMVAGVCGGIANYLNIDPTVARLLWVLTFFMAGSGLLAYIICAIIIPSEY